MKNRVKIVVDGKSFTLVGEETEEHMREVAAYVDTKMRQLRRDAVSVRLDSSLAYALTSLNIADEYYKEKNRNAELEGRIIGLTARVTELTAQLERKEEGGSSQEPILEEAVLVEAVLEEPILEEAVIEEPILEEAIIEEAVSTEAEPIIVIQGAVVNGAEAQEGALAEPTVAETPKAIPMAMKGNPQGGKQYKNHKKQHYGRR